jgi:hypothetical protein
LLLLEWIRIFFRRLGRRRWLTALRRLRIWRNFNIFITLLRSSAGLPQSHSRKRLHSTSPSFELWLTITAYNFFLIQVVISSLTIWLFLFRNICSFVTSYVISWLVSIRWCFIVATFVFTIENLLGLLNILYLMKLLSRANIGWNGFTKVIGLVVPMSWIKVNEVHFLAEKLTCIKLLHLLGFLILIMHGHKVSFLLWSRLLNFNFPKWLSLLL